MSTGFENRRVEIFPSQGSDTVLVGIGMASTEDKLTFAPLVPIDIVRWGFVADVVMGDANTVLAMDFRPTIGSDTARVNGATDSTTFIDTAGGVLTGTATTAVGKGEYHNVNPPLQVDPGEEVVIEMTTAPASGNAFFFIEYEVQPFVGDSNVTAGDFSNRIANMTERTT